MKKEVFSQAILSCNSGSFATTSARLQGNSSWIWSGAGSASTRSSGRTLVVVGVRRCTITFHDALLATYFGDTTTRFFDYDINRDGVVDDFDSCVNVDIRFTDTRETQSICEVFGGTAFPGTGPLASLRAATLATQPVSPLLWWRN